METSRKSGERAKLVLQPAQLKALQWALLGALDETRDPYRTAQVRQSHAPPARLEEREFGHRAVLPERIGRVVRNRRRAGPEQDPDGDSGPGEEPEDGTGDQDPGQALAVHRQNLAVADASGAPPCRGTRCSS